MGRRDEPTSSPSKISSPLSWVSSCISSRAVVDLPQPDSPTTPRVSPFITVKLISSTAWTTSRPLPPRKYFSR
ncbi:hypothetical protein SB00610_04427 [Klebsiella quasipneumoniae subsp. similipneumoniae]|nr:hypothetical protein SB00610_04427 [Klebsiella quasipneumoniae subsp. similipneumoniae]